MRNFTRAFRRTCAIVLCIALGGSAANATTYTAVVSGNFNAGLTWGGSAPGALLSTDVVIIPAGITVTMTSNEAFSGTSSLTVLGTLTGLPGTALTMTSGTLAGTGTISADSMALGLTSGFTFTGPIVARKLASLGATIATASNITVTKSLNVISGTLNVGAGSLIMGSSSTIAMTGGTLLTTGTGVLGLDSLHSVTYGVTSALTGMELGGLGIDSIIINTPGTVTMTGSTTVKGVLSLASGSLVLAGNTLTFGPSANLLGTGTGTITGSALSNVTINTTGGLTGALRFATGPGGTLSNLVVNTTTGAATLGSDVSINNLLTLTSGALALNDHTLTLNPTGTIAVAGTGTLTGSALSNLVVNTTGGLTGALNFTTGGNLLNNLTLNTTTGGATLASDLGLNGVLTLSSGTLSLAGHTLTLNPTADVSALGTGTLTGSATSNLVANTTGSLTGAVRFATGGNILNNLTVNTGAGTGLSLGSDLGVSGLLTLTAGTLSLVGHTLTLNPTGNISATGAGTITGSALSNLTINTTGSLAGTLRFATGLGGTLNNLVVNTTTGAAMLGSDVSINNLLTLTSGALALNDHTLTLNPTGTIAVAGTGTLTGSALSNLVVNTTGGLTGALNFTTGGNLLNNLMLNTTTGGATLASDLGLNGVLTLSSGTLSLAGHTLTLNPTADVSALGTGTLTGSATSNLVANTTGSLTGAVRFATGGNMLNNLTVNTGAGTGLSLGSDLNINGLLTLTGGTLSLVGHTLTLNPTGNISATGAGTITGSALSNVIVNTTGGLTGTLRFATGPGCTLNNLVVNTTTGAAMLGSDLSINNLLTLTSGALALNNYTLTLNPTGNIAAAGTGTLTGSALSNLVVNTTGGLTNPLNFTTGGNLLNNLTLNTTTGGAALSSDLGLNGVLTLSSGTLSLAGHTLTLNPTADVSALGTGTLTGSATSNLVANTTGSLTGAVRFATGGNMLNNLTVNTGAGTGMSLGSDLNINGLLTLTGGTLSLGNNILTLNPTGNISATGTGTITGSALSSLVVNTTGGLTGTLRFATGLGGTLNNLMVNTVTGAATLGSDVSINNLLTLTSGALALNGHTLTLNTTGAIAGTGKLTGSALSNLVVNTTGGLTGALNFTTGGNLLNNLTLNTTTGGATLASDLGLNGVLTLSSGTLSLAGHTLTLNPAADVAASGTGTLTGSATSNLVANTTGSLTGAVRFATGGNMLNNLTVNMGSGIDNMMLGSNLTIQGALNLVSGKIKLGVNNLAVAAGGTVSGGTANSYVITDGTGSLIMNLATSTTDTFKVGSVTNFAPMALVANAGATTGDVSINVADGVLSNGTTGTSLSAVDPMVNTTWFVSSTAGAINYNMVAMWSAGMEVNGFNRTNAFISHYTGGAWDVNTPAAAGTSGSLYSMTRTGITSLSPFMVRDGSALSAPVVAAVGQNISIYPNPATNTLSYTTVATIGSIEIVNLTGQVVKTTNGLSRSISVSELPAGSYFIHFYGTDVNTVLKFVKD